MRLGRRKEGMKGQVKREERGGEGYEAGGEGKRGRRAGEEGGGGRGGRGRRRGQRGRGTAEGEGELRRALMYSIPMSLNVFANLWPLRASSR